LRATGLPRREAILLAPPIRLRPILMTTAATVLGMLPLALGFGAGSELRIPMAIAIMGGLLTSTVLSLVVVPVVYDSLSK
jgi:multidrug efflux pump subunit AcrB